MEGKLRPFYLLFSHGCHSVTEAFDFQNRSLRHLANSKQPSGPQTTACSCPDKIFMKFFILKHTSPLTSVNGTMICPPSFPFPPRISFQFQQHGGPTSRIPSAHVRPVFPCLSQEALSKSQRHPPLYLYRPHRTGSLSAFLILGMASSVRPTVWL